MPAKDGSYIEGDVMLKITPELLKILMEQAFHEGLDLFADRFWQASQAKAALDSVISEQAKAGYAVVNHAD